MMRAPAGILLLTAASLVSGCAAATTQPQSGIEPVPASASAPAANPADVAFMTGMIHHHAQALVMAALAEELSTSASIRVLSERITVSQNDEIALMELWLRDHGLPVPDRAMILASMAPGAAHMHGEMMPGMVTPEQMSQLAAARGETFDRLYLTFMIQHHEGAMEMVETLFAAEGGGADDFIYKVASDTFADQGSEIDRMQGMLANLSGGSQ